MPNNCVNHDHTTEHKDHRLWKDEAIPNTFKR
jgi:hypothetical protein